MGENTRGGGIPLPSWRITPACAGKSDHFTGISKMVWNPPAYAGGKAQGRLDVGEHEGRITPAYAGKSAQ